VPPPSDEDIQKLYDQNKAQLGGQTLDELKPKIQQYLVGQASAAREAAYIEELKRKYPTTITLEPPKIQVDTAGRESRGGGADAPVTIIAFSDYECPFCKRAGVPGASRRPTNDVRYVHRDFPLPFHALQTRPRAGCTLRRRPEVLGVPRQDLAASI
jgi:protein-disulfide isomerase